MNDKPKGSIPTDITVADRFAAATLTGLLASGVVSAEELTRAVQNHPKSKEKAREQREAAKRRYTQRPRKRSKSD